jgi:hypothetical protein
MHWTDTVQDKDKWHAIVNMVMNILVPQNIGNFLTSLGTISFTTRTLMHGDSIMVTWEQCAIK